MKTTLLNIFWLGLKEIRSLLSDTVMVVFVIYAFTLSIQVQATGTSSEVNNASIAFVDEDQSLLSKELRNAFYPPRFKHPETVAASDAQEAMDFRFPVAFLVLLYQGLGLGQRLEAVFRVAQMVTDFC